MHLFHFKQYLQYYPEAKVVGGGKCKNHKKLHQFCSKISVHLKTDYHITTHYPREKKNRDLHQWFTGAQWKRAKKFSG